MSKQERSNHEVSSASKNINLKEYRAVSGEAARRQELFKILIETGKKASRNDASILD